LIELAHFSIGLFGQKVLSKDESYVLFLDMSTISVAVPRTVLEPIPGGLTFGLLLDFAANAIKRAKDRILVNDPNDIINGTFEMTHFEINDRKREVTVLGN
jgi:hypothetical protein